MLLKNPLLSNRSAKSRESERVFAPISTRALIGTALEINEEVANKEKMRKRKDGKRRVIIIGETIDSQI